MNLPESVDDPSLLQHEPLCSYVTMVVALTGQSRSALVQVRSHFVDAMQQDDQAAAAARKWASLVFEDHEDSLEVMGGGEELYRVFLDYQCLLHQGQQHGCIDTVREFQARLYRRGIGAIMLKRRGANTERSAGGRGRSKGHGSQRSSRPHKILGSKKAPRRVETSVNPPETGDITISSSTGLESRSTVDSSANDAPAATAGLPILPAALKRKHPTSKKRKAISQKPPSITPSDVSEDDKEPSETRVIPVANSTSYPPKRFASSSCGQPGLFTNNVHKKNSTHGPKTDKRPRKDIGISQPRSTLTNSRFDIFASHPSFKGRGARSRLTDRRRVLKLSGQAARAGSNSTRLQEVRSRRDLQTHATKRFHQAEMSTLDVEGSESTHELCTKGLQERPTQEPPVIGPPLTQENVVVEPKVQRKRTRLEFVVSNETVSVDSHEILGPDSRLSRPLPQKVRDERLVSVSDKETAACGVPSGAPSLEHADQSLRDVASNALAILREGTGSDLPDWTQDEGHDAGCDDICGHDQNEASDVQLTAVPSATPVVTPKPPLSARPRVWAQSRQEVCESFEYFRCYHSGVYSKDNIVKGYLLGAYAASRDIFHHEGKLIISHGGGKSESVLDPRRGPRRYQTDQDQEASDKSVRALLKTHKDRRPIALLADDKYAIFPYDLASANYTYVVLGFYWISHAWAECQAARDGSGRIVRWKFAFQWCEGQGDPWWTQKQEITDVMSDPPSVSNSRMCLTKGSPHPADTGGDPSIQCKHCAEQSPFIYKQGWMCLNPCCNVFWSINGEDPKQLDYREEFLSLLPQKFERLPNLTPTRVVDMPNGVTTTYAFSKGWHCTECGRLSCRYKWEYWECSNCRFKYVVSGRIRSPKEFWHQRPPKGFLHSQIGKDSGILASPPEPINLGTHKSFTNHLTFVLPYERGKIHLILGTPLSNGDADRVFQLYQQQASTGELKLRRYPLRNHRARGLLLTNYFSQNSGEPYQYVGGSGHTVPLQEAPDCVRQALELIRERSGHALSTRIPFNEVLSAAYMERQKMSFHSDSEKGLGPIVASLSLGSTALMHFRPHVNTEDPKDKGTLALTLVLRHGDVLVMEGSGVQKYYEHTVVPMNFRIAATARCIGSA